MKNKRFSHNRDEDFDDYEYGKHTIREEKVRRPHKNWTKFYQEHEDDYDDLEDFHNRK